MDGFSKHIKGRRGAGCPCPCCVETSDKRGRSRLARSRLKRDTAALVRAMSDETIHDNDDPCAEPQQD